ncbi:MAG: DUF6454 family protein [Vicinamibacterales bacterium]
MIRAAIGSLVVSAIVLAAPSDARRDLATRVAALTRDSRWQLVATIPVAFPTFHPQGMVKIGDTLFVSSVEVQQPTRRFPQPVDGMDRDAGRGVGHLFKIDATGRRIAELTLGEGSIYHPGGLDFDGTAIWVPVAEYRPNSRSIVYRVNPETMTATEAFRFADHLGGLVHDTDDRTLHGVSWGSRRFYRWTLDARGRITNGSTTPERLRTLNPSHYIDYQDCKYAGRHQMVCTGVAEFRPAPEAPPFRLGGIDLIDLRDRRPVHQVPLLLWTPRGLDMSHNPVWLEATPAGVRGYFMPEDDASTIYVYETR